MRDEEKQKNEVDKDQGEVSGIQFCDSVKEAKKNFVEQGEVEIDSILDNLMDHVNDHGVTIAHDAAVPDNNFS